MSRASIGFFVGLLTGIVAAAASAIAFAQGEAEERALVKVIADRQVAWNSGDAEGYARLLTPDADLSSSSGQIASGRDAVIQLYLKQREGLFAGATTAMTVVQSRLITPNVAIVDVDRELTNLKAGPAVPRARTTFVLVKQADGRWLITAQRAGTQTPTQ